ncbi:putative protein (DUF1018 domain) [Campylobacter pinnipediorum subsp. caledonicus]|uniref:Uncharacterized protein n=1 Tax=Campylobacter pinnipediorum subsp. caledonicus TaxID=1874362 RepID=A0A1S6U8W2_9BACT|nr:phage protein GemA/Gp16 family protein [Campylobacter pinnipediorum]AQW85462.1 putative protein (DUF1018 domain) [Campylobacter pinnipediorum subsp. caledonicus]AQW87877.1 putative protein (DUF1018 domain) [Campylobacter pinnipediorum subsp. caledonicus]
MTKETELKKYYIKMIHTLKHNYFVDDECRKAYLKSRYGKDSLKELGISELRDILTLLGYKKRYNSFVCVGKATKRQIKTIYGIWNEVARDKSEWALRNFCFRIVKKRPLYLEFLDTKEASNLILALKNMKKESDA